MIVRMLQIAAIKARLRVNDGERLKPRAIVDDAPKVDLSNIKLASPPDYKLGDKVATRAAYGTALAKLGTANARVRREKREEEMRGE